jgi:AcrR family transcriptional regulator
METTPSPRWQRRPDARPDEILDAALEVFGAQGFAGARLDDIARAAGVSKGTLYLYFESKEEMFRAMIRARIVSVLEEGERELLHAEGSTRTRLEMLMRRIWAVVGDPKMARIIKLVHGELNNFPELARFYYEEVILRVRTLGLNLLAQGVAAGEVRPEQAQFAARAMPSLLVMGSKMLHFFAPLDPAPLTADVILSGTIDLVLNGVLPRDSETGR